MLANQTAKPSKYPTLYDRKLPRVVHTAALTLLESDLESDVSYLGSDVLDLGSDVSDLG